MPSRAITKIAGAMKSVVEQRRFEAKVLEEITKRGAVVVSFYGKRYTLETLAGTLRLRLDGGTILCSFDNVDRACEYVNPAKMCDPCIRLNAHSGEWNFHYGHSEATVEDALTDFVRNLLQVRPEEMGVSRK